MVRKIVMVAILLTAGVGIAMYLRHGPGTDTPQQVFTPRADASQSERIADLEKVVAAQVERINSLEGLVRQLETRPGNWGGNRRNADGNNEQRERMANMRRELTDANGNFDPAKMRERQREQQLDRLVQAGLSRERAEWVNRRVQELQLQAEQAQFDAQRNGQQFRGMDIDAALRKEMGDAEYEKYLAGTGRPTDVRVMDVLASSPAERAGLKPGDQIVSYGGTRVFEMGDLRTLTRQGNPGEAVTIEVRRDGQIVQMQVARGVLGVEGGGGRRGGGFQGGPPGGFGGGPGGGRPGG
jgi:C-terminal processing protease CtpA/Prc